MQIPIETYRGWEITFETESEKFSCYSNSYDNEATKKSYSAVKTYIDDFIKENAVFTPITVEANPSNLYLGSESKLLIGIRKDGIFVYKDNKGKMCQISKHNEKDYILYDPSNDEIKKQVAEIDKELDALVVKKTTLRKTFKMVTLEDYKKTLAHV